MAGCLKKVRTMSRKLKRLIEEEEKTMSRITELQDYLKQIREARKREEDLEIIKSIRCMKLGARELFDLLTAIQDGNLSEDIRAQLLAAPEDVTDPEAQKNPDYDEGAPNAPEREENDDDRHHD